MPSSYTANLRLVLPATGELSGAWGSTVNAGLTSLVDTAIAGSATITMTTADYILTADNGAADEARSMFLVLQGTPAASRNVICPAVTKLYYVTNNTAFAQTLKTASGAGVSIPVGKTMVLRCDGTNVVEAAPHFGTLSASSNVSIDGGTFTFNSSAADRDARFAGTTDTNLLYIDASANAVGVGTATPFAKLHVAGTLRQNDTSGNYGYTVGTTTAKTVTAALASGGYFSWQTNLSGTDQMTLDTSGNLTVTGAVTASSLNSGQLAGFRNKIINGQFDIWQRGTSGSTAAGGFGYVSADRWYGNCTAGITCTISRNTTAVGAESTYGKYYLAAGFTGTGASGSNVGQRIEGVEQFGGKTVTISFYAADTVATSLTVTLLQNFGTGGSPSASVATNSSAITITSSFGTRYTATITLPSITGKTLGTNNDSYLDVIFVPSVANAHIFSLGAVQVEYGSVATPFEQRPIGTELALCQRYCISYGGTSGVPWATPQVSGFNGSGAALFFPVIMRTAPSLAITGTGFKAQDNSLGPVTATISLNGSSASVAYLTYSHASLTENAARMLNTSDTSSFLRFSAEL